MNDKQMGRPPEDAGPGHYSSSEAARIIGRSAETIRTWIRTGRLEGDQYVPQGSTTPHYRAKRESVHREAERLRSTATPHDVDLTVEQQAAQAVEELITRLGAIFVESDERIIAALGKEFATHRAFTEDMVKAGMEQIASAISDVLEALCRQREEIVEAVGHQESEIILKLERMAETFGEVAKKEQLHQQESLRIQRETLDQQKKLAELLERVERAENERRKEGLRERRGFFRRLFTSAFV